MPHRPLALTAHAPGRRLVRLCLLALLSAVLGLAQAQSDEIEGEFKRPDAAETLRLQKLLDQPVAPGLSMASLDQIYWDKELASRILGDNQRREEVLRAAVAAVGSAPFKRNLGQLLLTKGQFDEGNALMRQAIAEGLSIESAFAASTMVCDLYRQNRDAEARTMAQEAATKISQVRRVRDMEKQVKLWRAAARRETCLSLLEDRIGHSQQAAEFARSSEEYARMALRQIASVSNEASRSGVLIDVAGALARKLEVHLYADRLFEAERVLGEYLRFSREYQLPPSKLAELYELAARLRFAQREFVPSERFARKADATLAATGLGPLSPGRVLDARDTVQALIGQHQWARALAELERLDRLAADDPAARSRLHMAQARGMVYLENGRPQDAIRALEAALAAAQAQYGPTHFHTAQASGLLGAALWRSGAEAQQARAFPLLKTAVRDFMAPVNADFLESTGIRKEVREIIFGAYLEAASGSSVQEAIDAMGPADWARGGVVKDALNDAAVRSSAATPALADVVRREQDAKNEIAGLRRFLSGELGAVDTALPMVAAQMRERIAVLEAERLKLQSEVKAKFPNYDRLVHPQAPRAQEIQKQLAPDQALVLVLPSRGAVYVWALTSDQPTAFMRADTTPERVAQLVARLRRQLDFGTEADAGTQFDGAAAYALYDQLLAPLQAQLAGKTALVVAAGGPLSQIPFGLLHTAPGGGFDAQAPWLIRKMSVSQVPSLSSWLAIKALARSKPASQPFAGWADPVFDLQAAAASSNLPTQATRHVLLTRAAAASATADLDALAAAAPSGLKYARIPSLPDTREELQSIAATLQADPAQDLLLGARATRDSVLKASASGSLLNKRVLAFATHGLMAGDLPKLTQPALALAATGREDAEPLSALLTLEDVLTLKLNADWVV
ncbi:MAG: tetratricopeptide repeat protein, partial [Rhodoferax sp.]|nr:tetratricopeptide repeat protein [Rhodoferax sp.]